MDGYVLLLQHRCYILQANVAGRSETDKRHGNSLNANEQREFAARMERKQLKEFMTVRLPPDTPILNIAPIRSADKACVIRQP